MLLFWGFTWNSVFLGLTVSSKPRFLISFILHMVDSFAKRKRSLDRGQPSLDTQKWIFLCGMNWQWSLWKNTHTVCSYPYITVTDIWTKDNETGRIYNQPRSFAGDLRPGWTSMFLAMEKYLKWMQMNEASGET